MALFCSCLVFGFRSFTAIHGYGTIHEENVDWKVECDQVKLAYVAKNKKYKNKNETKTNTSAILSPVQVQDLWRQSKWNQKDYGERICETDEFLSLEWKAEGVIDGKSEFGDCDEVMHAGWGEPGGEWTGLDSQNEEGSWFHR